MVARNKNGGANPDGWWDDLPPAVRRRVSRPTPAADDRPPAPETYRPAVVSDLSRLAVLFLAVAVANLLFLLVALSFLSGAGPLAR